MKKTMSPKYPQLIPAALLLGAIPMLAALAAPPAQTDLPIVIDASGSPEIDFRNNTLLLKDVVISQGALRIKADQATAQAGGNGPDVENGEWVFSGNVLITSESGSLRSATARINIKDNTIANAIIVGAPATFEQKLEGDKGTARGSAGTIEYDVAQAIVHLKDNAHLVYDEKDIRAQNLTYSIRNRNLVANTGGNGKERVRITIQPPRKPAGAAPEDKQKPSPPAPGTAP